MSPPKVRKTAVRAPNVTLCMGTGCFWYVLCVQRAHDERTNRVEENLSRRFLEVSKCCLLLSSPKLAVLACSHKTTVYITPPPLADLQSSATPQQQRESWCRKRCSIICSWKGNCRELSEKRDSLLQCDPSLLLWSSGALRTGPGVCDIRRRMYVEVYGTASTYPSLEFGFCCSSAIFHLARRG